MNKLISIVLLCVLLFGCVSGCASPNPPDTSDNTPEEETAGLELENTSDLVIALCQYLKDSLADHDMDSKSFANKVDDIKQGTQALHVAFKPDDCYFVCGYFNRTEEHIGNVFYYGKSYTWVKFENANEIRKKYKDLKRILLSELQGYELINKKHTLDNFIVVQTH